MSSSYTGDRWRQTSMSFTGWQPDYDLWGGDPREIMAEYTGRKPKPIEHLGTVHDLYLSEWDPESYNRGWRVVTFDEVPDSYTFSDNELQVRYHDASGRPLITCGYCEAKMRSRDLAKLRRWFRDHKPCCTPYVAETRRDFD